MKIVRYAEVCKLAFHTTIKGGEFVVDLLVPGDERHPIVEVLLILITAGFAVAAVAYASEDILSSLIPLACALMFFAMYLAHTNVIGGG